MERPVADQVERGTVPGRALVPLTTIAGGPTTRPMAGFVTQLIACHRRLPAYRQARRAEPAIAAERYGAPPRPRGATFDSDA